MLPDNERSNYDEIKIVITCNMKDILKELCDRFEENQIILIYKC